MDARLNLLFLAGWILLGSAAALQAEGGGEPDGESNSQEAALEELRRLVQQQQLIIQAQQKRLDELERKFSAAISSAEKPTAPAPKDSPLPVVNSKNRDASLTLYGFLRGDLESDSSRMSFDSQLPFFVLSPADPSQAAKRAGDVTFHPRLTRFGFDLSGPARVNGWKVSAKLETDFFNAVIDRPAPSNPALGPGANNPFLARDLISNSRAALRIRQAYIRLQKDDWHLLAGQAWDVISPLFPSLNADTVMWNAGNTADRRPQLRVGFEPAFGHGRWSFVGAAGASGAVDNQDLDGDGFRDGEAALTPTLQARVGYSHPSHVTGQSWSVGLYGHRARQKLTRFLVPRQSVYGSWLGGLDLSLPMTSRIKLQGEFWRGQNLSDVRGGIGQGIDLPTGREVRADGGWAEANLRVHTHYLFNLGATFDHPNARDLTPSNARTRNGAYYWTNRFPLGHGLSLGLDYGYWQTQFKRLPIGVNHRLTFFVQQDF